MTKQPTQNNISLDVIPPVDGNRTGPARLLALGLALNADPCRRADPEMDLASFGAMIRSHLLRLIVTVDSPNS